MEENKFFFYHKVLIYFITADMPLLLILLQDQHPLVPSNSAHMSWFQNHRHLSSKFVVLTVLIHHQVCASDSVTDWGMQRYAENVSDC